MNKNWPTKAKDMYIAQKVMEEHASKGETESLGLFELVVNTDENRMNFRLASWVLALAQQYAMMYGANQGDYVTRQVISRCMTNGQT